MRRTALLVCAAPLALGLTGCASEPPATAVTDTGASLRRTPVSPAKVCSTTPRTRVSGPPDGAVVVTPRQRLDQVVAASPAGTTYWLTKGTYTLGRGRYAQVVPRDGDTFLAAAGAVLDGKHRNRYAFGGNAANVTIDGLTVRRFGRPGDNQNEGVVNHDSGTGWRIVHSLITGNAGAGVMLGDRGRLLHSCLSGNGQYAFNAYRGGDGITGLVVEGNEIVGNNADDWEKRAPGCGCTGGGKFWAVRGARVVGNYVHDNRGPGLWADTNNAGFLFRRNYIADNDGEGIFYEISYNARITGNVFLRNGLVKGPANPGFPTGAVYLSESGSDSRVPGPYGASFQVDHNRFVDNWSGVVAWENADRFAGSPANTSGGYTTLVSPAATLAACRDRNRGTMRRLYDDCRWRTQHLDVHANTFWLTAARRGCRPATGCGVNALISNYGSYPAWSPYRGFRVAEAIVGTQDNRWHDNTYVGPWQFMAHDQANVVGWSQWRSTYGQDAGSTSG